MSSAKILIVENEALIAHDILNTLFRLGYDVSGPVSSGEEAVSVAETESPDLILMDINLNGTLDGIEAANQIHHRYNIPVVYLSANFDPETAMRIKASEASAHLVKPYLEKELCSTINTVLESSKK